MNGSEKRGAGHLGIAPTRYPYLVKSCRGESAQRPHVAVAVKILDTVLHPNLGRLVFVMEPLAIV
jgi:hypothetical protein